MKVITICHYSVISPVGEADFGASEANAVAFCDQMKANGFDATIKVKRTKQKI